MVIMLFNIQNKEEKFCLFKKTFLFAKYSRNVIFKMLYLNLNNIKTNFFMLKRFEKTYIITKAIQVTKQFKLIRKKEFAVYTLNLEKKMYKIYKISLTKFDLLMKFSG